MDAHERRRAIMGVLERAKDPVSGSTLAREVGVSRQVVVQDIALLRADGHDIVATNRGYVLQEAPSSPAVPTRLVKRAALFEAGQNPYPEHSEIDDPEEKIGVDIVKKALTASK